MGPETTIDPKHQSIRALLRVIGPLLVIMGGGFAAAGLIDYFSDFASSGQSKYFWCLLVGIPLIGIGSAIARYAFMGAVTRYLAGEVAPMARNTFYHFADESSEGMKTFAQAMGQGIAAGKGPSAARAVVNCHKCNHQNPDDARFCNNCGTALLKTEPCPRCGELNDPDTRYCDNCGHHYT